MRDGRGEGQGRRGRKRARKSGGGEEGERLGQHCTGAPSSKRDALETPTRSGLTQTGSGLASSSFLKHGS